MSEIGSRFYRYTKTHQPDRFLISISFTFFFFFQNQEITFSIYETEWYKESLVVQKQIKLFMMLNHRPCIIRMLGIFSIKLSFIAKSIKNLYSAIQVILKFPHEM